MTKKPDLTPREVEMLCDLFGYTVKYVSPTTIREYPTAEGHCWEVNFEVDLTPPKKRRK